MVTLLVVWTLYVFFVHTFVGQKLVVRPLLATSDLQPLARGTMEVVWHFSTVCLALAAAAIAYGATRSPLLLDYAAAQILTIAVIFLWLGPRRFGSGLALPQWLLLAPLFIGVVSLRLGLPWAAATLLAAIGLVHLAWAAGLTWPSPSRHAAPAYLTGGKAGSAMPGRLLTVAVGVALIAAAAGIVTAQPLIGVLCAAVFLARGAAGLFATRLFPAIRGTPFASLNLVFYSPLCLFIAGLLLVRQ